MTLNDYSVTIPEGNEVDGGYVEMVHGANYTLHLGNETDTRCDAEVHIDGKHIGTWRIDENKTAVLERPANDTGKFTFYRLGTSEAIASEIKKNEQTGMITVIFKPEYVYTSLCYEEVPFQDDDIPFGGDDFKTKSNSRAGGTGLSGKSYQEFNSVQALEYDLEKQTTIHIRLIAEESQPRPLRPTSTPIPPPIDATTLGIKPDITMNNREYLIDLMLVVIDIGRDEGDFKPLGRLMDKLHEDICFIEKFLESSCISSDLDYPL